MKNKEIYDDWYNFISDHKYSQLFVPNNIKWLNKLELVKKWEERKDLLEEYFQKNVQAEYGSYKKILEAMLELVLRFEDDDKFNDGFDYEAITEIDNGDYQGTFIFVFHVESYQPEVDRYYFTSVEYGSCSGCDTLQAVCDYEDGLPTEEQVQSYMTLALHMLQKIKPLIQKD